MCDALSEHSGLGKFLIHVDRIMVADYVGEGVNFFETKRSFNLAWDVIVITLMKLEHHIQPQGILRTRLEKMISYMTSSEDPMNAKVNRGKKYLAELEAYPKADFTRDLYVSHTFIPGTGTPE